MSGKLYLRKATAANTRLLKAEEVMEAARKEREDLLRKALIFITSVSEAVTIYRMTDQKDIQILAWTKAVMLLGSTTSEFGNLLMILECHYRPTQKEEEIQQHLNAKRDVILEEPTAEQLHQLYELGNWEIQKVAKEKFEKLINNVQDLEELERWKELMYSSRRTTIWDTWRYERAVKRLSGSTD